MRRLRGWPTRCLPPATLRYGQSVTDACMDFATTAAVLAELAAAVRTRRQAAG